MTVAALVAFFLLAVIALFQLALALGAPLGATAWGGRHRGVLPMRLRIASGVAASVIYPMTMVIVLASAGLIEADWLPVQGTVAMWVLSGLFAVGALANIASRSKWERCWGPIAAIVGVCCAIIATGT